MKNILGIGNALVDIMTLLENDNHLQQIGLKKGSMELVDKDQVAQILTKSKLLKQTLTSGGSVANTIHGTSRLGIESGYIGKIGKDKFGTFFAEDLKKSKIYPHLIHSQTETGKAIAFISQDAERTFATYLGAAVEMTPNDLDPQIFSTYDILHIEGYLLFNHDLILKALELAKKFNLLVSLDMASFNVVEENRDFLREIIKKHVNIIFANEEEAKAYTNTEPEDAIHIFAEETNIAIVKMGKKGSIIKRDKDMYKIPAINANTIDTTGAGDLYAAGFLTGILKNKSLQVCGNIGSFVAGKITETIGAKLTNAQWQDIYSHF